MLVLSRKIGERIHIGENITIEIRRVAGNRVTLALEAPRTVRILRGELEQAAREFRDSTESPAATNLDGTSGYQQSNGLTKSADDEPEAGPEPYAVIHRRLHVLPQFSPQSPISHSTPTVS